MRNKATDLHNILFEQLEILNDQSLEGDALFEAMKRSEAITNVSSQIINLAKVQVMYNKITGEDTESPIFMNSTKVLNP